MLRRFVLRPVALATVLLLSSVGPLAAQAAPPARNRPLIALIDTFLLRPFNDDLRVGLLDSANVRPDVMVDVTASVTPFICYGDTATAIRALDGLLMTAYVAGNMREQLRTGRNGDASEFGLRAELAVYDVIRSRVANYFVPELNEWKTVLAAGRLPAYADSLRRHPLPDCVQKPARFPPGAQLGPTRP